MWYVVKWLVVKLSLSCDQQIKYLLVMVRSHLYYTVSISPFLYVMSIEVQVEIKQQWKHFVSVVIYVNK